MPQPFLKLFATIWGFLTNPLQPLPRGEDKRHAAIAALFLLLSSAGLLIERITAGATPLILIFILFAGYLLARTRWHKFATMILIIGLIFPPFIITLTYKNPDSYLVFSAFAWMIIPILLTGLLYSARAAVLINLTSIGALSILPLLRPELTFAIIRPALIFTSLTSFTAFTIVVERIRTEKDRQRELNASQERFYNIFRTSPDAISISLQANGYIIDVNENFTRMFGYSREECIGRTSLELAMYVNPADRFQWIDQLSELSEINGIGLRLQRKDGTQFFANASISAIELEGQPCLIMIMRDITHRKHNEELIQKRAAEFESLYQTAQEFSRQTDLTSLLAEITKRASALLDADNGFVFLYDPEHKVLEFRFSSTIPLQGQRLHIGEGLAGKVAQTREAMNIENYHQWTGRADIFKEWEITACLEVPMLFGGVIVGVLGVENFSPNMRAFSTDAERLLQLLAAQAAAAVRNQNFINQIQQKSAELEASNDELTRFTYTVSHDLRSPLVTIKGFLGALMADIKSNRYDRVENDMQRIANAADKMDALLTGLLELSRIGRIVNPPVKIDSARLIQDAIESVDARIRSKNAVVNVAPDLPEIYGDRIRLREVFENLIDNAIKYAGEQTTPMIEIGARRENSETIFFVKDNGIGIEEKYQSKIFGLFEKLNPTIEGTGIGLALVKRIVETHGGKIWVESEGLGKGSVFYLALPK